MKPNLIQNTLRITVPTFMVVMDIGHLTFHRDEFQAQAPRWLPSDPKFLGFVVLSSGIVEIGLGLAMIF